ncbi:MAG: Bug family tripartite tricarboxylate transporter substrate binding protein [Burkholderiales bacterium]
MNHRRNFLIAAGAAGLSVGARAQQTAYPSKPVRVIVASGAGSGDDFTTRLVAARMSELLGQQFIVENRPGAGGMIGQTAVAKAAPDGYTLLLAGGSMAGSHYVNANMGYDLMRDFTPISLIEVVPWGFVANAALPVKNAREFIAYARARPGKLNYGTIGVGQIPYWAAKLFNRMAGIDAVEVVYKGTAEAMIDVAGGRLDYFFPPIPAAQTSRDKVRIVAVTSRNRSEAWPDVQSLHEDALPGYEMTAWRSFMGPAGLPRPVVETLNRAVLQSLATPDVRERLIKSGSVPSPSTPEELRARYADWMRIFGQIAKDIGLKPQ